MKRIIKYKYSDSVGVFLLFTTLFWCLINYVPSDFQPHINFVLKVNSGEESYPPHFLFFYLINLFSGFSNNITLLSMASCFVLAASSLAKYVISKIFVAKFLEKTVSNLKKEVVIGISIALLFSFSIPDFYNFFVLRYMYLSRVPANVWHNSTLILVFPFALLLFLFHLKISKKEKISLFSLDILVLTSLIAVNIFIKPSFLFVFFPVYFLSVVRRLNKYNIKDCIIRLSPLFIGVLILAFQYVLIYLLEVGALFKGGSTVGIGMPFEYLRHYIPYSYVPIGLLISYIFPLVAVISYKEILKFKPFYYAAAYAFFAFLISMYIVEEGPRKYHGNFTWQDIVCMYILTLSTVSFLTPKFWTKDKYSWKMMLLSVLFILQSLSGILYLLKMYYTKSFS